jgi:hypothetical protein
LPVGLRVLGLLSARHRVIVANFRAPRHTHGVVLDAPGSPVSRARLSAVGRSLARGGPI